MLSCFLPQCSSFFRVAAMVVELELITSKRSFSSSVTGLCFFRI